MMFQNMTPFPALMWEYINHEHLEHATALVRVKFRLSQTSVVGHYDLEIDPEQESLRIENHYYEDDGEVLYPSDVVAYKPFTDLILNVTSYAPSQIGEKSWECSVGVRDANNKLVHRKSLRVFGKRSQVKRWVTRKWKLDQKVTEVLSVPIRYKHAYGGEIFTPSQESPDSKVSLVRVEENPIGVGVTHKKDTQKSVDAPSIEGINAHVDGWKFEGFGAVGTSWQSRFEQCGTYDEEWLEKVHPLLPKDFNPLFYHAAHPDMIVRQNLTKDSTIELENLHPKIQKVFFKLPEYQFIGRFETNTTVVDLPLRMDTIVVDANAKTCDEWSVYVSWRNHFHLDEPLSTNNMLFLTEQNV
jgi:hypothetical protein